MSSKKISQLASAAIKEQIQNPDGMAPGTCRIIGKITSILPDLEDTKETPCGQVPCKALVQVQKVIGYGTAFNKPLAAKQEITIYFSFTLNPTASYFPELISPLPGLNVGDVFLADLHYIPEQHPGRAHLYKVNLYKLLY